VLESCPDERVWYHSRPSFDSTWRERARRPASRSSAAQYVDVGSSLAGPPGERILLVIEEVRSSRRHGRDRCRTGGPRRVVPPDRRGVDRRSLTGHPRGTSSPSGPVAGSRRRRPKPIKPAVAMFVQCVRIPGLPRLLRRKSRRCGAVSPARGGLPARIELCCQSARVSLGYLAQPRCAQIGRDQHSDASGGAAPATMTDAFDCAYD